MTTTSASAINQPPAKKSAALRQALARKPSAKVAAKAGSKPKAKAAAGKPPKVQAKTPTNAPAKSTTAIKASAAIKPSAEKLHIAVVRDSFTMTVREEILLKQCKRDAIVLGRETKKSEVLRAAIQHFAKLTAAQRNTAYGALEAIKTGRPKRNKR